MKKEIKSVSIVFENCEVLDIPFNRIGIFIMDDITSSMYKREDNTLAESSTIGTLFIEIFNRTKDLALNRIIDNSDIVSIYLNYNDETEDKYYVDFNDDFNDDNEYQNSIKRENGDILVLVSKDRFINEFVTDNGDNRFEKMKIKEEPIEGFIMQNKYKDPRTLKAKAKKFAIKEIEKLYGSLAVDIDASQGAMEDLEAHLEELNVYEDILYYLKPDYNLDYEKLFKETCESIKKDKSKDE